MISHTGRMPAIARPFAIPTIAASLMGVFWTRPRIQLAEILGNLKSAAIGTFDILAQQKRAAVPRHLLAQCLINPVDDAFFPFDLGTSPNGRRGFAQLRPDRWRQKAHPSPIPLLARWRPRFPAAGPTPDCLARRQTERWGPSPSSVGLHRERDHRRLWNGPSDDRCRPAQMRGGHPWRTCRTAAPMTSINFSGSQVSP